MRNKQKRFRVHAMNTGYCAKGFKGALKAVSNSRHQCEVLCQRFKRGFKSGLELTPSILGSVPRVSKGP